MYDKEGLQVFLIFPVKGPEGRPQPPKRWFVLRAKSVVKVHQSVVVLYVLVQSMDQISVKRQLVLTKGMNGKT